ncbi:MAG: hypothetical protein FD128_2516, partial [Hyphomonadaceae bacterium]
MMASKTKIALIAGFAPLAMFG